MLTSAALALIALAALLFGSDLTVGGARAIARRLGVSPLIVGLTLTSIGTSLPEIATNVAVGLAGQGGGLAVGNVVGSCLSQVTLLFGLVALVRPPTVPPGTLRRDGVMLLVALMLMAVAAADGEVSQLEGGALILSYGGYLAGLAISARRQALAAEGETDAERSLLLSLFQAVAGMVLVVYSAGLLVDQGVLLARGTGVPDTVVGLIVGVGTGLPELMVSLRAVRQRESALSLGNLIGSNITDPLLSLGAGAVVAPMAVAPEVLRFDLPYWLFCTVVALIFLRDRRDLNRNEASVLVMLFALYLYLRVVVVGL